MCVHVCFLCPGPPSLAPRAMYIVARTAVGSAGDAQQYGGSTAGTEVVPDYIRFRQGSAVVSTAVINKQQYHKSGGSI